MRRRLPPAGVAGDGDSRFQIASRRSSRQRTIEVVNSRKRGVAAQRNRRIGIASNVANRNGLAWTNVSKREMVIRLRPVSRNERAAPFPGKVDLQSTNAFS